MSANTRAQPLPAASRDAAPAARRSPPIADRARGDLSWYLVICGYFAAQALWRRALGGGLTLDEAEMLLWSRHLAWGYGSQPPLYSWLQWLTFQIVPDRLLALALLKNALLATFYLAVYRLLRCAHPPRVAGPAALSLFLLPQISWESQRDLTHSVLVLTMAALATLAFWTRTLAGRRGGWLLFGIAVGFGLLAKANFVVVPAALLLAAASLPELRPRLSGRGIAVAGLATAAVAALPVRWMLAHPDLALTSVDKLGVGAGPSPAAALAAIGTLAQSLASLLALLAVVLGAIVVVLQRGTRAAAAEAPAATPLDRLLLRTVAIGLALVLLAMIAGGMPDLRDRWLTPAVYLLAPAATVGMIERTGSAGGRALLRTIAVLAALVFVALAVHVRYGRPGDPSLTRAPVEEIAATLDARFPGAERIVAEPAWLAGNLLYRRPDLPVVSSRVPGEAPEREARVVAAWWTGDRREEIAGRLAANWGGPLRLAPAGRVSAAFPIQPAERLDVDTAGVIR